MIIQREPTVTDSSFSLNAGGPLIAIQFLFSLGVKLDLIHEQHRSNTEKNDEEIKRFIFRHQTHLSRFSSYDVNS